MKRISNDNFSSNKKKKTHKNVPISRSVKPLYGSSNTEPPYYDPHDCHVHDWVCGKIPSVEDPHSKFYSGERKEFHGTYCRICHLGWFNPNHEHDWVIGNLPVGKESKYFSTDTKKYWGQYCKICHAIKKVAPYYDPYDCHRHIWTYGDIGASQNPHSEFHARSKVRFKGRYCKVCHMGAPKTPNTVSLGGGDVLPRELVNIETAMKEIEKELGRCRAQSVSDPVNNWKRLLGKFMCRNIWGIRYQSDRMTEDLILENVECEFYWESKVKKGIIICQLPSKEVLVEEYVTSIGYKVNPHVVVPIYSKYYRSPHLYPIGEIPRLTLKENIPKWKQKWSNYQKWETLQFNLKYILPEECQCYQTFYEDEIPELEKFTVDTLDVYMLKKKQNSIQILTEYREKKTRQKIMEEKLGEFNKDKYDIYTFLIPPDKVKENYVIVRDETLVKKRYPKLELPPQLVSKFEGLSII